MGTGRKIIGWISVLLAIIFSGCVIGWLHCVRPQLFGSAISGRDIAFDYVILYLLWWCLAPATTACMAGGPFFLWCAVLLPTELLFALVTFRKVWPVGVLLAALWLIGLLRFRRKCLRQFRRKSRRCHYSDFDILCGQDRIREICRRFGGSAGSAPAGCPGLHGACGAAGTARQSSGRRRRLPPRRPTRQSSCSALQRMPGAQLLWTKRPPGQSRWFPMSSRCWASLRTGWRSPSRNWTRIGSAIIALLRSRSCSTELNCRTVPSGRSSTRLHTRRSTHSRPMW